MRSSWHEGQENVMSEEIEKTLEDGRLAGQMMFVDCPAYLDPAAPYDAGSRP